MDYFDWIIVNTMVNHNPDGLFQVQLLMSECSDVPAHLPGGNSVPVWFHLVWTMWQNMFSLNVRMLNDSRTIVRLSLIPVNRICHDWFQGKETWIKAQRDVGDSRATWREKKGKISRWVCLGTSTDCLIGKTNQKLDSGQKTRRMAREVEQMWSMHRPMIEGSIGSIHNPYTIHLVKL